jgi:Flp pilus assembly protein TadD
MLHLLKGKCYDRQRQFKRAVLEYGQAIELA